MKTQTTKWQKITIFIAVIALTLSGLTLLGCSPSSEDLIKTSLASELDKLKNLDKDALSEELKSLSSSVDLSDFGIDQNQFLDAWLTGFDYKVDKVVVEGEKATATVTITVRNLSQAMDDAQQALNEMSANEEAANMSADERKELIGTTLLDAIKSASMISNTIELPYVLNNNVWSEGSEAQTILGNALIGQSA